MIKRGESMFPNLQQTQSGCCSPKDVLPAKRKSCDGRRSSATGKVYHPAKMLDSVTPPCRGQWAGGDASLQRSLGGGVKGKKEVQGLGSLSSPLLHFLRSSGQRSTQFKIPTELGSPVGVSRDLQGLVPYYLHSWDFAILVCHWGRL